MSMAQEYRDRIAALSYARMLIAQPNGWTQNAFTRTADGKLCDENDPSASCYCTWGAIRKARRVLAVDAFGLFEEIRAALGDKNASIPAWNDTVGRTQAEVIAVFDTAIRIAQQKACEQ